MVVGSAPTSDTDVAAGARRAVTVGEEDGGIASGWLVQLLAVLLVLGFIGYEGISIAAAHLALDEDAREVAVAARSAYGGSREAEDAIEAGRAVAESQGVVVVGVVETEQPPEVVFELRKQASTLVIHRFGFLEEMTHARTSRRVQLTR